MQKTNNPLKAFVPPLLGVLVIGGIAFAYNRTQLTDANTSTTQNDQAVVTKEQMVASPEAVAQQTPAVSTTGTTPTVSTTYKNGTYSGSGTYMTPEGSETISVKLTVANDVVTSVTASVNANSGDSRRYIQSFMSGYKQQVVGKSLSSLNLGRVSGSSLTPEGFNNALDSIRAQAQAQA